VAAVLARPGSAVAAFWLQARVLEVRIEQHWRFALRDPARQGLLIEAG